MRSRLIAVASVAAALAGCGSGEEGAPATSGEPGVATASGVATEPGVATAPATTTTPAPAPPPALRPPPCPAAAANCERASGQVVYVQRVDPDGDGDAHFVLISDASITGPGISVIDVRAELRPDPLPRPGDFVAASGPVYEGSYGQRQIQADAVRVRYAR